MSRAFLIGLIGGPILLVAGGYTVALWSFIWPVLLAVLSVIIIIFAMAVSSVGPASTVVCTGPDPYPEATARLATVRDQESVDGRARRAFDPNPGDVACPSPIFPLYNPHRLPRRTRKPLPTTYYGIGKPKV